MEKAEQREGPRNYLELGSQEKIKLFFFFVLLGPHLWHMEVPRLGVELEL